jgi:Family of unknown function (DUF6529)
MDLVQGNPTEVKVVLASVATALAVYQVVLAAIGYRKLRIIEAEPAFMTHRASGDTIAVLLVVVAIMCLSYFELEDSAFHAVTGFLLLVVLAVKVVVIRWWHAAGRFLPVLGISVFVLLVATWASTAGAFLS